MNAYELKLLSMEPTTEVCDNCNAIITGWEFPRANLQADGETWLCKECNDFLKKST